MLEAMASNLEAMTSNLEAMASDLKAMASNLEAMASNLEAMACLASASRLEAIAKHNFLALFEIPSVTPLGARHPRTQSLIGRSPCGLHHMLQ